MVNTRLDMAYCVGVMSRYMEAPTTTHMTATKRILRYVCDTIDFGCCYDKKKKKKAKLLVGYSDGDLA